MCYQKKIEADCQDLVMLRRGWQEDSVGDLYRPFKVSRYIVTMTFVTTFDDRVYFRGDMVGARALRLSRLDSAQYIVTYCRRHDSVPCRIIRDE